MVGGTRDRAVAHSTDTRVPEWADTWVRTYYASDEGKLYCEFQILGPPHQRWGGTSSSTTVDRTLELEPAMFR